MFDDLQEILSGNQAIPVEVNADEAIAKMKTFAIPGFIILFFVMVIAVFLGMTLSKKV